MASRYGTADSPSPSFPRDRDRRRGSIIGPLLLIAVGSVLLLQNLGVLSWDLWGFLWRLWPLALIAIGAELLLGNRLGGTVRWLIAGLFLLVLVALVAAPVAWFSVRPGAAAAVPVEARVFTQDLQGARQAEVEIDFGAGRLVVDSLLERGSDQLAVMRYDGPEGLRPVADYRVRNGVGQLQYGLRGRDGWPPFLPFGGNRGRAEMHVQLAPNVPLALNLEVGAAESMLDLSALRVARLDLETGASTTRLRLPAAAGATVANVSGGAATLDIDVPENVAAQISFEGGASTLNVDQTRFPRVRDQVYRSPNYETAPNRVDLRIEAGASTVTVR